ncbi:hypothetical protein LX32DRAFT_229748 [Colletotrichum zoysiae]|uniref:Uncharacterized protein n=1 Tax=Colletotrichum zoysiae TaxID=1216348 RepID=A0AAD9LTX7_9PEZI|nr:hypothetical protein LX32DRAFT_229748 [Colletotrichum zoysiae]
MLQPLPPSPSRTSSLAVSNKDRPGRRCQAGIIYFNTQAVSLPPPKQSSRPSRPSRPSRMHGDKPRGGTTYEQGQYRCLRHCTWTAYADGRGRQRACFMQGPSSPEWRANYPSGPKLRIRVRTPFAGTMPRVRGSISGMGPSDSSLAFRRVVYAHAYTRLALASSVDKCTACFDAFVPA